MFPHQFWPLKGASCTVGLVERDDVRWSNSSLREKKKISELPNREDAACVISPSRWCCCLTLNMYCGVVAKSWRYFADACYEPLFQEWDWDELLQTLLTLNSILNPPFP